MEDLRNDKCKTVECRTRMDNVVKAMTSLENDNGESLLLEGCVSCPHGPRRLRVSGIEWNGCRGEVELPRFTDDAANQEAREVMPNTPHRTPEPAQNP